MTMIVSRVRAAYVGLAMGMSCLVCSPGWAASILVGHPVTAGLATALTQGTSVPVVTVVPASIPMGRQFSFLTGRGETKLAQAAVQADSVLSLRSAWSEDPLFPLARRSNIRLVEVDVARPVDGALPGIALSNGAVFPWLGIANMGRMADIAAADLRRLYPEARERIDANLARMKGALLSLSARAARDMAAVPDPGVVLLSPRFTTLANDLGLDVRKTYGHDDADWTADRLAELTGFLRAERIAVVVHHREPGADIVRAVTDGGARLVVLDSLESGASPDVVAVLSEDFDRLKRAFGEAREQ